MMILLGPARQWAVLWQRPFDDFFNRPLRSDQLRPRLARTQRQLLMWLACRPTFLQLSGPSQLVSLESASALKPLLGELFFWKARRQGSLTSSSCYFAFGWFVHYLEKVGKKLVAVCGCLLVSTQLLMGNFESSIVGFRCVLGRGEIASGHYVNLFKLI